MAVAASFRIRRPDDIGVAGCLPMLGDESRSDGSLARPAAVISLAMQPAEDSADELVRAFVAGDGSAFERLYDRHERRCFQFMRRMLAHGDEAEAEDLHQEVWLAVARTAASFDPGRARFVT